MPEQIAISYEWQEVSKKLAEYFPYVIQYDNYRSGIKFCYDNFGPDALSAEVIDLKLQLYTECRWTYDTTGSFYFRDDRDAVVFKMFFD